jgi:predicted membrane protein
MDPAITSKPVITTPSPVIVIIILRSCILYIKDSNTTYRSIYQRNKRLKRLNLRVEISTDLDSEIPVISINALVILIYSILPNLKKKKIIRIVKTNG